jgi:hypothetical protein
MPRVLVLEMQVKIDFAVNLEVRLDVAKVFYCECTSKYFDAK